MPHIRLSGEPRIEFGAGTGVQSMGFKRADPHIDDVYPIMDPLVTFRSVEFFRFDFQIFILHFQFCIFNFEMLSSVLLQPLQGLP